MVALFLDFKKPTYCSPYASLYSHQQGRRVPFFLHPLQHVLFDDGHSDQCEVIPHSSFDFHFSSS